MLKCFSSFIKCLLTSVSFNSRCTGESIDGLKETSHIIFILMSKRHFKVSDRQFLLGLCSESPIIVWLG